jgi:hypothetical protein
MALPDGACKNATPKDNELGSRGAGRLPEVRAGKVQHTNLTMQPQQAPDSVPSLPPLAFPAGIERQLGHMMHLHPACNAHALDPSLLPSPFALFLPPLASAPLPVLFERVRICRAYASCDQTQASSPLGVNKRERGGWRGGVIKRVFEGHRWIVPMVDRWDEPLHLRWVL